jgi:hypothetical protein
MAETSLTNKSWAMVERAASRRAGVRALARLASEMASNRQSGATSDLGKRIRSARERFFANVRIAMTHRRWFVADQRLDDAIGNASILEQRYCCMPQWMKGQRDSGSLARRASNATASWIKPSFTQTRWDEKLGEFVWERPDASALSRDDFERSRVNWTRVSCVDVDEQIESVEINGERPRLVFSQPESAQYRIWSQRSTNNALLNLAQFR